MSYATAIETVGGFAALTRFKAMPNDGHFGVSSSTDIRVNAGGLTYPIDISSVVNFSCIDFAKVLRVVDGHSDLRGINKRLIKSDMDTIDTAALRSYVSKAYTVKTDLRAGWVYSAEYVPPADSHVTLIYGMLSSWYKALLWTHANANGKATKATSTTPARVTMLRDNYKDSHVTVTRQQDEAAQTTIEIDIGEPNDVDPAGDDFVFAFSFNAMATDRDEVVLLPHLSSKAYTWYIKHVAPKTTTSEFNFDIKLPGIEPHKLSVRTTSGNDPVYAVSEDLDWTDAASMWSWLSAYVVENRVESHFAAAFEIFSSVVYRPIADTAEGFLFSTLDTEIVLPRPRYYRARFPGLLEDDPWMVPAEAHSMLLRVGIEAHAVLGMAGVSNYVAHIGAVATAMEGTLVESDLNLAIARGIHSNPYMDKASEQRAACIYAVLGREVQTALTSGMGVRYPVREYGDMVRYPNARKTAESSDVTGFDINSAGIAPGGQLVLPASPALLYGHCSEQLTALSAFTANLGFSLPNGRDSILQLEEAFKLANVYRAAGYDPEFVDVQTGQLVRPFSSLKALAVQLSSMRYKPEYATTYQVAGFKIRNADRLQRLPTPEVFMDMSTINVTINTGSYNMEEFGRRGVSVVTNYRRAREMKRISVRVSGGVTIGEVKVARPKPLLEQPVEGFQALAAPNLDAPQDTEPSQIPEL
uniref:Capsid protein n=1 Tax=Tonghua Totiv tick virus 1 TaxID=2972347 RepID=A0A9E7V2F0_9VIRU|nr:MAG: capsid protein [Tonghua Totiv tick virus 1]